MIVLGILASFAAIAGLCWLVFNLAVFALPFLFPLWLAVVLFAGSALTARVSQRRTA